MTSRDAAAEYLVRGWAPIPVPWQKKAPLITGWQKLRVTAETLGTHFNGARQNIGVLLGDASGGLVDVDLDCHEVAMAKLLLADVRRNAPENTPVPADNAAAAGLTQGMPVGEVVHSRAQTLIAEHPGLDYHEAMGAVLAADPGLKARYAGVQ